MSQQAKLSAQRWSSGKHQRQQQHSTATTDKPAPDVAKPHEDPMQYKSQGKLRSSSEVALAEERNRHEDATTERANSRASRKLSMDATDFGESRYSKSRPERQVSTARRLAQEHRQAEAQAQIEANWIEAGGGEPLEVPVDDKPSKMPITVREPPSLDVEEVVALDPGHNIAARFSAVPPTVTRTGKFARTGTPRHAPREFTPLGFAAMTEDSLVMHREKLARPRNCCKRLQLPGSLPAPGAATLPALGAANQSHMQCQQQERSSAPASVPPVRSISTGSTKMAQPGRYHV